jgi:hypothetical protein
MGHRNGAVRKRTQLQTKIEGEEHRTKWNKNSRQFMTQKKDDAKFKGVRKGPGIANCHCVPTASRR